MAEPASPEMDTRSGAIAVRLRGATKAYDNGVTALGRLDLDVTRTFDVALDQDRSVGEEALGA